MDRGTAGIFMIDDFAKSAISALRAIFEESHVRRSTLNSSKIAQALILDFFQSRLISTFYGFIMIEGFVKRSIIQDFLIQYFIFKKTKY